MNGSISGFPAFVILVVLAIVFVVLTVRNFRKSYQAAENGEDMPASICSIFGSIDLIMAVYMIYEIAAPFVRHFIL